MSETTTQTAAQSGPKWWTRRWVQLVAVGLIGLGVGASGSSGDAAKYKKAAANADARAEAAESRADAADSRVAAAEASAANAQAAAKVEAAAGVKDEVDKLNARAAALDARSKALDAREKAVGIAEASAAANTFDGDGVYIVGADIKPGTYKSAGGENCYWARHNKANDILDNHLGSGPTVVVVRASDFSLEVSGCAEFHKV